MARAIVNDGYCVFIFFFICFCVIAGLLFVRVYTFSQTVVNKVARVQRLQHYRHIVNVISQAYPKQGSQQLS